MSSVDMKIFVFIFRYLSHKKKQQQQQKQQQQKQQQQQHFCAKLN